MIPMIQSLFAHQAWADDAILNAIRDHPDGATDEPLRKLIHHIVTVQRFFLSRFLDRPFDPAEMQLPDTLDVLLPKFDEAHRDGIAYAERLDEAELARSIEFPRMPEFRPSIREALMQVAMHSEHHRAQCAMRLRSLGGKPPITDYIIWVRDVRGNTGSAP